MCFEPRHSAPEAVVLITLGIFSTPFIQREWRIGHHAVEFHEPVIFQQQRAVQGVAPFYPGAIETVQEHVHAAERPCATVGFLSEEGKVVLFLSAARAAGYNFCR